MSKYEPVHFLLSKEFDPSIPSILPHDKVYSIQVGYKLFRLSGASLSSDAPSFFTKYFLQEGNEDTILFIDRSPQVFEKIYTHLQGYHVNVDNDTEFVHLWLDSFYYSLPRLQDLLNNQDVFCSVGGQSFRISKEMLVKTGNYPNFFLLSCDSLLTDNTRVIEAKNMLRPPPQRAPTVSNRSAKLFNDLLEVLKGNPLVIKDDQHRKLLVKECKYYRFLALEQNIIKHKILWSPFTHNEEILLDLFDVVPSSVLIKEVDAAEKPVLYSRPYIKEPKRSLIFQIENKERFDPSLKLVFNQTSGISLMVLFGRIRNKFVLAFKDVCPTFRSSGVGELLVLTGFKDSRAIINGQEMKSDWYVPLLNDPSEERDVKKRKLSESSKPPTIIEFNVVRSMWKVYCHGKNIRLHAVFVEAITDDAEWVRNGLEFL